MSKLQLVDAPKDQAVPAETQDGPPPTAAESLRTDLKRLQGAVAKDADTITKAFNGLIAEVRQLRGRIDGQAAALVDDRAVNLGRLQALGARIDEVAASCKQS